VALISLIVYTWASVVVLSRENNASGNKLGLLKKVFAGMNGVYFLVVVILIGLASGNSEERESLLSAGACVHIDATCNRNNSKSARTIAVYILIYTSTHPYTQALSSPQ
jgi:hypothetical protein